jgi:hypothetical protein
MHVIDVWSSWAMGCDGCWVIIFLTNNLGFQFSNNFKILKISSSSFSKKLQTTNKIHQITKFYKRVFDHFLDF